MSRPSDQQKLDQAQLDQTQRDGRASEKQDVNVPELIHNDSQEGLIDGQPTEQELATLRRVSGKIPFLSFTVLFVALCERFAMAGTMAVFVNFLQRPLPPGSTTGAAGTYGQAGALGMGQQVSTGLFTFYQFWLNVMPLIGGFVADQYLGRYLTVHLSILFIVVGQVITVISALPPVIADPQGALACFAVSLVITGIGAGSFKSAVTPLIADQVHVKRMQVVTLGSGERVIVDPQATYGRLFLWWFFMLNIGTVAGGVSMPYAEKYVGFWLAFMLPPVLFLVCPVLLLAYKNKYVRPPPTGSILGKAMRLVWFAAKGRWSLNPATTYKNCTDPSFWEDVKPSKMQTPLPWMVSIDDAWVDQVRRGLSACKVFLWYPLYWLTINQIAGNLTSQSATMKLNGAPNDVIFNLNPLATIILIPFLDILIYPAIRKAKISFTPIKRITLGFFAASAAMIASTVTQYYIYKTHPCGDHPNGCPVPEGPISVWVQTSRIVF